MSLNFDLSKIVNFKTTCYRIAEVDQPGSYKKGDELMQLATEAMIYGCMAVGMGRIKDADDALEYFGRMTLHEAVNGAMRRGPAPDHAPLKMTLAEVRAHIGLTTNATPETRTAWQKRFVENAIRSAVYDAQRKERQAADFEAAVEAEAEERGRD